MLASYKVATVIIFTLIIAINKVQLIDETFTFILKLRFTEYFRIYKFGNCLGIEESANMAYQI